MMVVVKGDPEKKFFSVRHAVSIGGKTYRPSVCYPLTTDIYATITELASRKEPEATMYSTAVRFVSGVAKSVSSVADEPILVNPAVSTDTVKKGKKKADSDFDTDGASTAEQ